MEGWSVKYLKAFQDRHRRWRIYLRRPGCKPVALPVPRGYTGPDKPLPGDCLDFLAAYQAAMTTEIKPGETRAAHGSVAWLVAEYFGSLDFLGRPTSVQIKHRRHIEEFRVRRGDRMVGVFEQTRLLSSASPRWSRRLPPRISGSSR